MKLETLHEVVGREVGLSEWFPIDQERIDAFSETTEDRQWIHVEGERAVQESPYGTTVAHGFLTLSLLSHLSQDILKIENICLRVNYGLNKVRFPAPVRAGARVRGRFALQALRPFEEGVDLVLDVKVEVEGELKPCCVAEWIIRYYAS